MTDTLHSALDAIAQWLTGAPLWAQAAVTALAAVPLCGVLAFILLRIIDVAGALTYRLWNPKARTHGHVRLLPTRHQSHHKGVTVVVHTDATTPTTGTHHDEKKNTTK